MDYHLKILKYTLYVQSYTSNNMIYSELGIPPLDIGLHIKYIGLMIGYWARLITDKANKLSYILYRCLLYLDEVGELTSPLIYIIKSICNDFGLSLAWQQQNLIG